MRDWGGGKDARWASEVVALAAGVIFFALMGSQCVIGGVGWLVGWWVGWSVGRSVGWVGRWAVCAAARMGSRGRQGGHMCAHIVGHG